jgi:hypothetical protein
MEKLSAKIVEEYVFSIVLRLYRKTFGFRPEILRSGTVTDQYSAVVSHVKNDRRTTVTAYFNELRVALDVSHSRLTRHREIRREVDGERVREHVRTVKSWTCLKYWAKTFNVADPTSKHNIDKFLSETFRAIKRGKY